MFEGAIAKLMESWGESKNFLRKVSFLRPKPHFLLQKLLTPI